MTDKIIPIALRLWLVFLFAFLLLGYAVVPSILFGAIGGFAGGMVNIWWQTPGGEPAAAEFEPSALERISGRLRPREVQNRLPFLKLFTRRDRRNPGSRRS
ncbi:MAG: hypothetical protein AAGE59_17170 [Cyanobacteria bacterium P01_F01_bin.86]